MRWSVVHLGLVLSRPSPYVDRAGFGQTASSTLVISYRGSIDRPWPGVEGEGWRRGRPKNWWGNRALMPRFHWKSLWAEGDASWQKNGLKNVRKKDMGFGGAEGPKQVKQKNVSPHCINLKAKYVKKKFPSDKIQSLQYFTPLEKLHTVNSVSPRISFIIKPVT